MSKICRGWCVTIVCLGAGCAGSNVETTALNTPPRALAPRAANSVEVYTSAAPTRPHVDVALLRANQANFGDVNTPALVRALAERAANMGCDAIFISGAAQRAGISGDLQILDSGSHGMLATCIAYSDSGAPSAGAPSMPANAIVFAPDPAPPPRPAAVVDNVSLGRPAR